MSITKHEEAELIQLKSAGRDFRQATKERLKEMIAEGDVEAQREYDSLFPKVEWKHKEKQERTYATRALGRQFNKIPLLICKTCGKSSDRVQEYNATELRDERRKTWRRVIKPNLAYFIYKKNRRVRNRRLFFSYVMMECLRRKHKLSLKFREKQTLVSLGYDWKRSR